MVFRVVRGTAWLGLVGFLLHGNWEWLQTFFYVDASADIGLIVWYRLHCTLVDVAVLVGCAGAVTLAHGDPRWIERPSSGDIVAVTLLGVAYTAISEQINVAMVGTWGYSALMPILPGTSIGTVPLLQWSLISPAAVLLTARLLRGGRRGRAR